MKASCVCACGLLLVLGAVFAAGSFGQSSGQGDEARQGSQAEPAVRAMPSDAEIMEGKAVFDEHCAICHYSNTTATKIAVGLEGIYARRTFSDGRRVNDATMTAWINNGGKDMPGFRGKLRPAEIRALLAYLSSL